MVVGQAVVAPLAFIPHNTQDDPKESDRPTAIINPLERLLSFVKNPNSLTCLILPDLLAAFDALIWLFEIVFSLGFRTITKFTSYLFIQYFCFAGFF